MKTILVTTDFSKCSNNALRYAIEIAKWKKSKIILFHSYFIPVIPGDIPVKYAADQIRDETILKLKKVAHIIQQTHKDLQVEIQFSAGIPTAKILECAKKNEVDLIVMGLQGSGYITEKLMGSITTSVIQQSHFPTLVINEKIKFKNIKRIALAFDYAELKTEHISSIIKEFTDTNDFKIFVLNVVKSELQAMSSVSKAVEGMKLSRSLQNMQHSFHYLEDEDVVDGINRFVNEQNIDLIVMIPRDHTPLYKLFNEPQTKRMAFHTIIPLLTIKE